MGARPRSRQVSVYVSGRGQVDNLGDSVLRRPYLSALREVGRLHVLVEPDSADYVANLGLSSDDIVYEATSTWWRSLLRAAGTERILIGYNAGEMRTSGRLLIRNFAFAFAALLSRRRSGSSVHIGCGIREQNRWSRPIGRTLARSSILLWRDPDSAAWAGAGAVAPDWAFLEGAPDGHSSVTQPRDLLAVSFRGDRAPIPDHIALGIRSAADRAGLELLLVVQVRRDALEAYRLSALMQAEVLDWPSDRSHPEQEERVRQAYRKSRAVVSDRVHALIMGATEGAIAIGVDIAGIGKLDRTFRGAGFSAVTIDASPRGESIDSSILTRLKTGGSPSTGVETARKELRRVREMLAKTVG